MANTPSGFALGNKLAVSEIGYRKMYLNKEILITIKPLKDKMKKK